MTPAPRRKPTLDGPGPVRLADAINLPEDLRPASKRGPTLPAGFEPMLSLDDLAPLLNCSRRLVERMRASKKILYPDMYIGRMPRWRPERIRRWIEGGNKL